MSLQDDMLNSMGVPDFNNLAKNFGKKMLTGCGIEWGRNATKGGKVEDFKGNCGWCLPLTDEKDFAGLGNKVYIGLMSDFLDKGKPRADWKGKMVRVGGSNVFTAYSLRGEENKGIRDIANTLNNPFHPVWGSFILEDSLYDARVLTKSIIRKNSNVPFIVKGNANNLFGKPWAIPDRFLPEMKVYSFSWGVGTNEYAKCAFVDGKFIGFSEPEIIINNKSYGM